MKSRMKYGFIIWIVVFVLIALLLVMAALTRITDVEISGNKTYSSKQIEKLIFKDKMMKNPFVFYIKTKTGNQEKIPFVSRYDVTMKSLTSVKISVYEKKIVGYISYFGTNMYFDKDGIVTESSQEVIEGIPKITGIDFDYIVLHEPIPVSDSKIFNGIMNITQLLEKYELAVDKIHISEKLEMTLYMGNVKVELGNDDRLNEKIIDLNDMRENLKDLSGTLYMREYDENGSGYTFKKN